MSEQKGVFRVNCIDCLDRTNVVQVRNSRFSFPSPELIVYGLLGSLPSHDTCLTDNLERLLY